MKPRRQSVRSWKLFQELDKWLLLENKNLESCCTCVRLASYYYQFLELPPPRETSAERLPHFKTEDTCGETLYWKMCALFGLPSLEDRSLNQLCYNIEFMGEQIDKQLDFSQLGYQIDKKALMLVMRALVGKNVFLGLKNPHLVYEEYEERFYREIHDQLNLVKIPYRFVCVEKSPFRVPG